LLPIFTHFFLKLWQNYGKNFLILDIRHITKNYFATPVFCATP
jgi:hypothetical protein